MPNPSFSGPQTKPTLSYNPAALHAMTVGFYPDAWQRLTGVDVADFVDRTVNLDQVLNHRLLAVFRQVLDHDPTTQNLLAFQDELTRHWQKNRASNQFSAQHLSDWVRAMVVRMFVSDKGTSLRQAQRRVKKWTGQNQRDLIAYARLDVLFASWWRNRNDDTFNLSELALETGFSDQSHMGRELRRLTGVSPAILNKKIETDESFWCYRLMGERF